MYPTLETWLDIKAQAEFQLVRVQELLDGPTMPSDCLDELTDCIREIHSAIDRCNKHIATYQ